MKRRLADLGPKIIACALALGLTAAALHDVSKAWDVWAYHLPFAARIAGIVGPDMYLFSQENAARFAGFPLLGEALQGLFWRLLGRPEGANLLNLLALFGLVAFLRRLFAVPWGGALIAFVAIPLVMIHATSAYVDLFANALVTMLLLLSYRVACEQNSPSLGVLAAAAALAGAIVNTKFQLVPITVVAVLPILGRAASAAKGRRARLLFCAVALPIVFATPIKNSIRHGSPVYPVEVHVLGKALPFAETRYSSSPVYLEDASRPRRFATSVLEIGVERWSIDQWTPLDHPGYRMGGFFGAYAVANVVAFALALVRARRERAIKIAALYAAGATLVTSLSPQSHELRYYLFWMLFLVSLNLVLWTKEHPLATAAVAAAALAFVAWKTDAAYLYPSGDTFSTLVANKTDKAIVDGAQPGSTVCLAREPWTFLHASAFHGKKSYRVQEATRATECP